MSRARQSLKLGLPLSLTLSIFALAGCGPAETDHKPPQSTTSTTGTTGGGGSGGSTGTTGGGGSGAAGGSSSTGGSGATGGSTGTAGSGGSSQCGNGTLDPGEPCDGAELGNSTCQSQGFSGGTLACSPDCGLDISDCTGAEICTNGVDDDGDLLIDCDEPDCQPACADPCQSSVALADPGDATGALSGHADVLTSSCVATSGSELAYLFTAALTGELEVNLYSESPLPVSLSVRSTCGADASELACSTAVLPGTNNHRLTMPVTAGQSVVIVVDGDGAGATGAYALDAHTRAIVCGDELQDSTEGCDDGNTVPGDGCSPTCAVEATETEPNATLAQADPYGAPWFAEISPQGDVDFIALSIPSTSGFYVATSGLVFGACTDGSMDSVITLLDANGNTLAVNDDHEGLCSQASVPSVPAGTYYARIEASAAAGAESGTFPYVLSSGTFVCGDGALMKGEECDDGNVAANDGCSPTCKVEVDESEPNGTIASADVYTSPWIARVDPDGDVDVVSVTVPGPASKITAVASQPGGGICPSSVDTYVEILKADGTVLAVNDDFAGAGYCSSTSATGLAAGTYYVRTQAQPFIGAGAVYLFTYTLDVTVE